MKLIVLLASIGTGTIIVGCELCVAADNIESDFVQVPFYVVGLVLAVVGMLAILASVIELFDGR